MKNFTMKTATIFLVIFIASYASAHEKVAVIPLRSASAAGSNMQVQYNNDGRLGGSEFYYNNTNKRFGLGVSSPDYLFHVKGSIPNGYIVGIHNTSTNGQAKGLVVRSDGGDAFVVQEDGNIRFGVGMYGITHIVDRVWMYDKVAIGSPYTTPFTFNVHGTAGKTGGGSWSSISDARLKHKIGNIENALGKITTLQPVTYSWKYPDLHHEKGTKAGFLAQDVEKVFPDWVNEVEPVGGEKALVGQDGKVKTIHFPHEFNAYLVEAIKELKAENDALKTLVCQDHQEADICR